MRGRVLRRRVRLPLTPTLSPQAGRGGSEPLIGIGHQPLQLGHQLVEQHADHADEQDGRDDVSDGEVVPLVPDEVADARAADQQVARHDHQPGDADGDAHPARMVAARRRAGLRARRASRARFSRVLATSASRAAPSRTPKAVSRS